MRNLTLFLTWICIVWSGMPAFAQVSTPEPEILKAYSAFFQKRDFPADQYQFDNQAINEQLSLALKYHNKAKSKVSAGSACLAFGGLIIIGGINYKDTGGGSGGRYDFDFTNAGKALLIGAGAVISSVSIPLFISSSSKAKGRNKALTKARQLFLEMNAPLQPDPETERTPSAK